MLIDGRLMHSNFSSARSLTCSWSVHPPGPKVVTTLSLLIKQNYPGTCISVDSDGRSCEVVVHYWRQYPPDVRATVLDEFLVSKLIRVSQTIFCSQGDL
jgi:hypothetical protein